MASDFSSPGSIHLGVNRKPKYGTFDFPKLHFFTLSFNPCALKRSKHFWSSTNCVAWFLLWSRISSWHVIHFRKHMMKSIIRPKVAGDPSSPMGVQFHSNDPSPGILNAVLCLLSLSNGSCQNPAVKSKLLNTVDWCLPISSIQSCTSRWLYLSTYDFALTALKSRTGRNVPSFLGTQKIGELNFGKGEVPPREHWLASCRIIERTAVRVYWIDRC